jgi:hypothetical protein
MRWQRNIIQSRVSQSLMIPVSSRSLVKTVISYPQKFEIQISTMAMAGKRVVTTLFCRKLLHSMALLYAALVLSSLLQTPILDQHMSAIKNSDWLSNHTHTYRYRYSSGYSYHANKKTLALLYPQGMIGGYRNQVIRLAAFVAHAKTNNISQLLLPSLLWSTTYKGAKNERTFFPVPMSFLFDVDHWNSFRQHLPILIDSIENSDCWGVHNDRADHKISLTNGSNRSKGFVSPMVNELLEYSALISPVVNTSRELLMGTLEVKARKLDLYPEVENCTNPYVYGGGRGAGRLWNDYLHMPKVEPGTNNTSVEAIENSQIISWVSQALQPSPKWRNVAHQCIRHHQPAAGKKIKGSKTQQRVTPYMALHARVEVDMMIHRCGSSMERNLTNIFSRVQTMMAEYNKKPMHEKLEGVFVAVSRSGMQLTTKDENVTKLATENWKILTEKSLPIRNETTTRSQGAGGNMAVFECGEIWMNNWYSMQTEVEEDYYGSLVPSIMNFYIATHATIFIGVDKSSWSTDVWTTRYYQGKGATNFEYTTDGIIPVPNGGLPSAHASC